MNNPRIKALLREAVQEEQQCKVCLIEDIIKAKKCLFSLGKSAHNEHTSQYKATKLFDELFDLDVLSLEVMNDMLGKQINNILLTKLQEA